MMLPPPDSSIGGMACLHTRKLPVTLTSIARRHSDSSISASGCGTVIAAALLETT